MSENTKDTKEGSVDFFHYAAAAIIGSGGSASMSMELRALMDRFVAEVEDRYPSRDVTCRGLRSGYAAFYLRAGFPPAELLKLHGVAEALPDSGMPSDAIRCVAAHDGFEKLDPATRDRCLTGAWSVLLTELFSVAVTEWHNASIDASAPGIRSCHVVAMTASISDAVLNQLGIPMGGANRVLSTPCGLSAAVGGLALVPSERRTAAAAETIRLNNLYRETAYSHTDLDCLAEVIVAIYG